MPAAERRLCSLGKDEAVTAGTSCSNRPRSTTVPITGSSTISICVVVSRAGVVTSRLRSPDIEEFGSCNFGNRGQQDVFEGPTLYTENYEG